MPKTHADAVQQIGRLIPVHTGSLRGDYAAVCTPVCTVPDELKEAQRERTAFYMTHTWQEGHRSNPPHGPRYFVTNNGQLLAWVTLDGRTHYADVQDREGIRIQDAIRDTWPERFQMNSEGDPVRTA